MDKWTKKNTITEENLTKLGLRTFGVDFEKEAISISFEEESTSGDSIGRTFGDSFTGKDYDTLIALLDQTKLKKFIDDNKIWEKYDLKKGEDPTVTIKE